MFFRRQRWLVGLSYDTDNTDRAGIGAHWQKQPARRWRRFRPCSGGNTVFPTTERGSQIGGIKTGFRWVRANQLDCAVMSSRQHQHGRDIEHRGNLARYRPQQLVECADAGELTANSPLTKSVSAAGNTTCSVPILIRHTV